MHWLAWAWIWCSTCGTGSGEGILTGGGRIWNPQFPWISLPVVKGLVCLSNLGDVNFYQLGNWTEIITEDDGAWDSFLRSLCAASRVFGRPISSKTRPSRGWTWGNAFRVYSFPCPLSQWMLRTSLFFRSYCAPYTLLLFWLPLGLTAAVTSPVLVFVPPVKLTCPRS